MTVSVEQMKPLNVPGEILWEDGVFSPVDRAGTEAENVFKPTRSCHEDTEALPHCGDATGAVLITA